MLVPSILKQFQADIVGLLSTCDYFSDITVTAEDKADIQNIIQSALAPMAVKGGKSGICVIVEEPEAEAPTTNPAPYFTSIKQKLTILENIATNRTALYGTLKPVYQVAESILCLLWQVQLGGTTQGPIWPGAPAIRPIGAIPDQPSIVGVEVLLEGHAALPQVDRVADPVINTVTSNVVITCATTSAALYYSTDTSFPSLAYSTFVKPAAGTVIRSIGAKSGAATSNIVSVTV